jgi:hypothetical protein
VASRRCDRGRRRRDRCRRRRVGLRRWEDRHRPLGCLTRDSGQDGDGKQRGQKIPFCHPHIHLSVTVTKSESLNRNRTTLQFDGSTKNRVCCGYFRTGRARYSLGAIPAPDAPPLAVSRVGRGEAGAMITRHAQIRAFMLHRRKASKSSPLTSPLL